MEENKKVSIEAATFRRIVKHFQENPEVQNIDLMELSGFCRNCISRWYSEEAEKEGKNPMFREAFDVVVSRGVAKLNQLAELTIPFCKLQGLAICLKGNNKESLAQLNWSKLNGLDLNK